MEKQAFCVHGHFYQPPREDPLTGDIPLEPGAMPYHNWNERIHAQCYRPNAEAGNFEHISFNIGPTLVEWLAGYDPATLDKIIKADQKNVKRNGVGNAMAQAYNHVIMPLASLQDKITQVRWGIQDFLMRFGRKPAGMWLPETAVDIETLEVLAQHDIKFTILAPWQAEAQNLDVSKPYIVRLPEGRQITIFFYQQELSAGVSFNPAVTVNADLFVRNILLPKFKRQGKESDTPQLLLIASDGELYGHHQPFRDKFLAYLMDGAIKNMALEATYPALWLEQYPAQEEIQIRPNTSWSCPHGVTRWCGQCDCTPHSEWKKPLRRALTEIAEMIDRLYRLALEPYLDDPWELRHNYAVVLGGQVSAREFIQTSIPRKLSEEEFNRIRYLLAAQYERQRMFTSCGWFFDDFDRIEPRNTIAYATHAVWLVNLATGIDLSRQAAAALKPVKSWRSGLRADVVFNHHLKRAQEMKAPHDIPAADSPPAP
ncbi:MAG: DUF3536 domain-containing protein [Anaerolineaceae bacterium]|nr:DUF3536 domain-containing protein [Anaerolineaceae bacterium]